MITNQKKVNHGHIIHQNGLAIQGFVPGQKSNLNDIVWDMQRYGFDYGRPLVLWKNHDNLLIDGHTRLLAARQVDLCNVPVVFKAFGSEDAALKYAFKSQQYRRNLSDGQLFDCVLKLSRKRGIHSYENSAREIALLLGLEQAKVEKIRSLIRRAPPEIIKAVRLGRLPISVAYNRCTSSQSCKVDRHVNDLGAFCSIIHKRFNKQQIKTIIDNLAEMEADHEIQLC